LTTGLGNTINDNHGAGIEYELLDQGTGTVNILGNTITGTLAANPASTIFQGQGIDIRTTGSTASGTATAALTSGLIDGNQIGSLIAGGNTGAGITIFADQNTSIEALQIGSLAHGNIIAGNGGDGINIQRANTAQVGDVTPISIINNKL